MKQHSVLLAVAATAIIAALAGCSTHSPYYDKDGPPSVGAHIESSSATPKIEAFRHKSAAAVKAISIADGLGGQPGTAMSTGNTLSNAPTIA